MLGRGKCAENFKEFALRGGLLFQKYRRCIFKEQITSRMILLKELLLSGRSTCLLLSLPGTLTHTPRQLETESTMDTQWYLKLRQPLETQTQYYMPSQMMHNAFLKKKFVFCIKKYINNCFLHGPKGKQLLIKILTHPGSLQRITYQIILGVSKRTQTRANYNS